jgi:hypothetical protein
LHTQFRREFLTISYSSEFRVYAVKIKVHTLYVELLAPVDISTCAPYITLNEQHVMACTSTMPIVLGCKIPHELDALKWKAIGRRIRRRRRRRRRRGGDIVSCGTSGTDSGIYEYLLTIYTVRLMSSGLLHHLVL